MKSFPPRGDYLDCKMSGGVGEHKKVELTYMLIVWQDIITIKPATSPRDSLKSSNPHSYPVWNLKVLSEPVPNVRTEERRSVRAHVVGNNRALKSERSEGLNSSTEQRYTGAITNYSGECSFRGPL